MDDLLPERRMVLEQKIDREWKSILCPRGKGRTSMICEWDIVFEKGRILKRTLKQIDCHNPQLTEFGGKDCSWECEGMIGKRKR
jgi:hypothetical protein